MKLIERVSTNGSVYLTRINLGRLYIHIFHRGDVDACPHDHPWDFCTFPLRSYEEEVWLRDGVIWPDGQRVYSNSEGRFFIRRVRAFRYHKRRAEHQHRVLWDRKRKRGPLVTVVWRGRRRRQWGFWVAGRFMTPAEYTATLDRRQVYIP